MTRRMNADPIPLLTGDSDWTLSGENRLDAETKHPGFWASCGWEAAGGELPLTSPNAWTAFTGPDLAPPPTPPLAVQLAVARRPVVDGDCRVLCVVVGGGA